MNDSTQINSELAALAAHLAERRQQILRIWLRAVRSWGKRPSAFASVA